MLRVEDGDTLVLKTAGSEITVRLLGVNAPERDECLHDEARSGLALYMTSHPRASSSGTGHH